MFRSWPGYAAPALAAALTLILVWVQDVTLQAAFTEDEGLSPALLLAGLLGLAAPFAVPALWGGAVLAGRPLRLVPAAAGIWLAASLGISPGLVVWPLAGYVLAGLAAGAALAWRWRLDAALAVVAMALAPYFIWSVGEVPVEQRYAELTDQYIEARREMLTGTADPKQVELTLEAERRQHEKVAAMALKILPSVLGLAVVGMAGVLLVLVWLLARLMQIPVRLAAWPRFGRWRLPFYLVWILVGGLGLFITRQPWLAAAGLNLALAVGTLLSIQGAAVQWELTGRTMGPVPRLLYLLVAGFLFLPLVLLGLADQWLDFRKLEASDRDDPPADSEGGGVGAPHDDAGDDAGQGDR